MELDSIKSILFGLTLVVIVFKIFKKNNLNAQEVKYLFSSFMITLLIFFIIAIKLHHILRLKFGIPDTLTYLFVLIVLSYHTLKFKFLVLKSNYLILIGSLAFLSSAVILDLITDAKIVRFATSDFFEEILRILGALFWLIYYYRSGFEKG